MNTRRTKRQQEAVLDELTNDSGLQNRTTANSNNSNKKAKTTTQSKVENSVEATRRYWLMKSEPESRIENGHEMRFGVNELKASPAQTTHWDGVRNYQARNYMRSMRLGDQAFFYHSNCKQPGLVATMSVCRESYVDHTQFDPSDAHYDPKCRADDSKWFMVDVKFERDLRRFIPLAELKAYHLEHKEKKQSTGPLANLALFTKSRLSVQPLTHHEWHFILGLESQPPKN